MSLYRALTEAGYSENMARQGWSAVPNKVMKILSKKGIRLKELGKIDVETQEQITRGRLVYNVIKGSDKGVLSAKALGSDRRVNMFTPDTAMGIIALQMPQNAQLMPEDERQKLLETPDE